LAADAQNTYREIGSSWLPSVATKGKATAHFLIRGGGKVTSGSWRFRLEEWVIDAGDLSFVVSGHLH
jgi:hypothetical protein